MFLSLHATAAIVLSESITSRVLGFFLGVISHFLLDLIPQGDFGLNKWLAKTTNRLLKSLFIILIDVIFLSILSILAIRLIPISNYEVAYWTVFGALVPDLSWSLNELFGNRIKLLTRISALHHKINNLIKDKLSIRQGMIVQAVTFIILIWTQTLIFN